MTSKIIWTDQTWNPVIGCSKVSDGCKNCYAERMACRLAAIEIAQDNPKRYEHVVAFSEASVSWQGWNGKTALGALTKPLHWRKPRRIFVCSMGDLFHESVPDAWIDQVFAVMAMCPQHTFQVLTKRAARMAAYVNDLHTMERVWSAQSQLFGRGRRVDWPPTNVWFGITCESQQTADERIPHLLRCPVEVRFVSVEPMAFGPVDIERYMRLMDDNGTNEHYEQHGWGFDEWSGGCYGRGDSCYDPKPGIDWVICGGESGPGARPMHPDWARDLRDQCHQAAVPFLFKQWGEWAPPECSAMMLDGQVVQSASWFADKWTYEKIELTAEDNIDDEQDMYRVGKKRAGRLLDGVLHDGYPEVAP